MYKNSLNSFQNCFTGWMPLNTRVRESQGNKKIKVFVCKKRFLSFINSAQKLEENSQISKQMVGSACA
jgi:hypothetical protein